MQANTPILVGSAQYVDREPPSPETSLSPADMAALVARQALDNCEAGADMTDSVDVLAVARLFEHSVKDTVMWPNPFGNTNNMPMSVARRVGLSPQRLIYAEVGGETPQRLVNQMCEAISRGEHRVVVLTGAEALATIRNAKRAGIELDWREEVAGDYEDLWPDLVMTNDYERRHGITFPIQVYALFEQVKRHSLGQDLASYRQSIGSLFEHFSRVAAENPYSQFPVARSAAEIAALSEKNFPLCEPYGKWMVAQDAVNQGAAVVLTSVGHARDMGIDEKNWIYLLASADLDENLVSERPQLSTSPAQGRALHHTLDTAGVAVDEVDLIDLYSCFPIAVSSACEHLGLPVDGTRSLTLTGGLPFFGGPGNNYSLHAIAEVVRQLRGRNDGKALVAANGGYLSKHSVGLYGRRIDGEWSATPSVPEIRADTIEVTEVANGAGMIESYAATYARGEPAGGYIVGRLKENDVRFLAMADSNDPASTSLLFSEDVIGREVNVSNTGPVNVFKPA